MIKRTEYIIVSNREYHPAWKILDNDALKPFLDISNPQKVFFPFWSWKVPDDVLEDYICIGFHTGDTHGGSPIQNLIRDGIENTYIRMFYMNNTIDGGNDIIQRECSLLGTLEEILIRETKIIMEMIDEFQKNKKQ